MGNCVTINTNNRGVVAPMDPQGGGGGGTGVGLIISTLGATDGSGTVVVPAGPRI